MNSLDICLVHIVLFDVQTQDRRIAGQLQGIYTFFEYIQNWKGVCGHLLEAESWLIDVFFQESEYIHTMSW
jgi:hypothetical protein